ncbi:chromosome replication/partitioning protein (plasmid) [Borrelia miyamotoi]|uniref:Chromosome replication/partitioning protein n=2 Tax=Borrelia miyamotoi TaxID=47466 RepID=A0AAQ3CP51_9SPIR|nr:chromosome replication/partitioning protein [Borrelia miyamotoi]MBW6186898.1 chromosome replication/partitioning protein [Pseudomonas aeruginosa]ATQ15386.1 chromosome replication/partitioning protein [Borrelia miyamotoi]ATQ16563.1 chromosome replication/partitioning protein [Borrelia miyamotoi]ATQ17697.1 chromosome replication/partitioning protein [Borrelia miyamotoi]ATQ18947.1 chromosome replication/partitioning protein [Borrelia miyamotoi]
MSKNRKIEIVRRIDLEVNSVKNLNKTREERYLELKEKLKILIKEESYNKIETARILKEINESKYYALDGYKSFTAFIKSYKIAKTSVYRYIKLVSGIDSGKIDYDLILNRGIDYAIKILESNNIISKSNVNPLRPLRFQLDDEESFHFYKSNTKFASFLLKEIFKNEKSFFDKMLDRYNNLKVK